MRFSIWPNTRQRWTELAELAQHAEASGWDGLWVSDHFMPSVGPPEAPVLECWTVLSALAVSVPRIRLGSLVSSNTYRHPAVLANMAASVDVLSGGRAVLGLGAGWQVNEHAAYGIEIFDTPTRLRRLDEACQVIRSLLDTTCSNFDGLHYQLRDAYLEPKPVSGHLPLLVGGGGELVTLRIVAKWADEWNIWGTPDVLASKGKVLARHCEQIGRDPTSIRRSAQAIVDLPGTGADLDRPRPTLAGTTEQLQAALYAYQEAGVSEFILPDWNLGEADARRDALDRFLLEIAAPFRAA